MGIQENKGAVVARIRTIKPEFPHSESMGRVSRDARLTFILLWTLADDSGRLRGNSRMLASLLFPYDDDAKSLIETWLTELDREGCIRRYLHEGTSYIQVCNWLNHQKIDKPSQSKLPAFDESSRIVSNPREMSSGDLDLDQGSSDMAASPPHRMSVLRVAISDEQFLQFKLAYPERNGDYRWKQARGAINARIREGNTFDEILAGTNRYAAYCKATGKTGTEYVKQASSFVGSKEEKPFLASWEVPASAVAKERPSIVV